MLKKQNVCFYVILPQMSFKMCVLFSTFISALIDVGFEIPNHFVVGYALDYNEYFRDLNVSPESADAAAHRT